MALELTEFIVTVTLQNITCELNKVQVIHEKHIFFSLSCVSRKKMHLMQRTFYSYSFFLSVSFFTSCLSVDCSIHSCHALPHTHTHSPTFLYFSLFPSSCALCLVGCHCLTESKEQLRSLIKSDRQNKTLGEGERRERERKYLPSWKLSQSAGWVPSFLSAALVHKRVFTH